MGVARKTLGTICPTVCAIFVGVGKGEAFWTAMKKQAVSAFSLFEGHFSLVSDPNIDTLGKNEQVCEDDNICHIFSSVVV
jgi:hypothetical protein